MRKLIFTTVAAAITLAAFTASPVQARYLQTDPLGYEDDINLYAHVGNDPINNLDPTGLCAESTDADGNRIQVGVCSDNTDLQGAIDNQIVDSNSNLGNVEDMLIAGGMRVDATADVDGGALETSVVIIGPEIIDGYAFAGEVTIGMQESTTLGLVGDSQVETAIPYTVADALEHEIGSHVFDQITGNNGLTGPGVIDASGVVIPRSDGAREARAINRTNVFRRRSGRPGQRSRYDR